MMPTISIDYAGAVLEVAADGVLGVEEAPGELLIHNGNRRRLRSVGKAYVASREQLAFQRRPSIQVRRRRSQASNALLEGLKSVVC